VTVQGVGGRKKVVNKKRTVTFTAFASEIRVWEAKAKADSDRPLSQWIRARLLLLDAQDTSREILVTATKNEISGEVGS
jgi:hypothetical protein